MIHPRKDDDRMPLGISSIFGTAKATQEADMVIILQVRVYFLCACLFEFMQKLDKIYLEVRKNRYDGTLGKIDMLFNTNSSTFFEAEK